MKKVLILMLVLLVSCSMLWAGGAQEEKTQLTVQDAQIASAEEDWDAIYEAAKEEGKVVIYSLSSRIYDALEGFTEMYPGIDVEAIDMPDVEQIDKITREQNAGVYNADVLMLANGSTLLNELMPKGYVQNYVPSVLIDGVPTDEAIAEDFQRPLLIHSMESKVIFYNTEVYPDGAPVDNLWDLTKPEWRGKVQMKDPMLTEENLNMLQTIVQHADEMEAAYELEFGKKLELSAEADNAGEEFIKQLLENDIVLTSSDGDAAMAVGAPGQSDPPLTLSVASSKIRYNDSKGAKLGVAWEVEPKVGITKANHLVMAANAPHPNAAKLIIRYMLGDANGEGGMSPFNVPYGWASRSDVEPKGDLNLDELREYTWFLDYNYVYNYGLPVRDFWMTF